MDRPETRFVWNGDAALAYQVLGDGTPDILYLPGWISNVELNWDHRTMSRFLRGLARSRRLVVTDPRGVGCSERSSPHDVWPLETIMEDIGIVLDEVGSDQAAVLATNQTGFVACMFAATYPERTVAVILCDASANYLWSEETPWEFTEEQFERQEAWMREPWTRAKATDDIRERDPSMADDRDYVEWWYRYCILSEGMGSGVAGSRKYMYPEVHVHGRAADPAVDPRPCAGAPSTCCARRQSRMG